MGCGLDARQAEVSARPGQRGVIDTCRPVQDWRGDIVLIRLGTLHPEHAKGVEPGDTLSRTLLAHPESEAQ